MWPIDTKWCHRTLSTLVQVMACCIRIPIKDSTNVNLYSLRSCHIHLRAISQEMLKISILGTSLKMTNSLCLQPPLPGANELTWSITTWCYREWNQGRRRIWIRLSVWKIRKNIYRPDIKVTFVVISDVYRAFIRNKTTFTKYCLTQWISKLPGSFEIDWVRQYMVNLMGLLGIVNASVYKTELIFTGLGHGKLS